MISSTESLKYKPKTYTKIHSTEKIINMSLNLENCNGKYY